MWSTQRVGEYASPLFFYERIRIWVWSRTEVRFIIFFEKKASHLRDFRLRSKWSSRRSEIGCWTWNWESICSDSVSFTGRSSCEIVPVLSIRASIEAIITEDDLSSSLRSTIISLISDLDHLMDGEGGSRSGSIDSDSVRTVDIECVWGLRVIFFCIPITPSKDVRSLRVRIHSYIFSSYEVIISCYGWKYCSS